MILFGALSQETRLDTFRLLVRHEPAGLASGDIARLLGVPLNTMSSHLAILQRAKLVKSDRVGRSIIYRADLDALRQLMAFMAHDCCGGRVELCPPLHAEQIPSC